MVTGAGINRDPGLPLAISGSRLSSRPLLPLDCQAAVSFITAGHHHFRMPAAAVVKVGGSLFSEVPRLAQEIRDAGRPVLIVPGGGQYADLVRMMELPDEQAHWMAIAAMEQYAWYVAVHGVETMDEIGLPEGIRVLLPYRVMRMEDPLPHTWEVTSDSISAWVAHRLDLPLLLLKSVDGLTRDGILQTRVSEAFPYGEVDPYFLPYVLSRRIPVTVANGRVAGRTAAWLRGEEVAGTVVGPGR